MRTLYTAKVNIRLSSMGNATTQRNFIFRSGEEREAFVMRMEAEGLLADGGGYSIDHIMTPGEAMREVRRDHRYIEDTYGV